MEWKKHGKKYLLNINETIYGIEFVVTKLGESVSSFISDAIRNESSNFLSLLFPLGMNSFQRKGGGSP
jgi:hypothetical protein